MSKKKNKQEDDCGCGKPVKITKRIPPTIKKKIKKR